MGRETPGHGPEAIFKQAMEEINSQYEAGTIPYVRENYPALWQKITETETRLSTLWLAGMTDDFKKAVDEWTALNHKAIEIFRERGTQRTLI